MTIIKYPVEIEFPYDYEYSIDNGSNWISVLADTKTIIPGEDLPANNMVKIRSSSVDATSIAADNISANSRILKSVNLRNGTGLTTLYRFLKYSIVDKVRISNCPNVTTSEEMLMSSIIKQADVSSLPSCTSAKSLALNAKIIELSNLSFSQSSAVSFNGMFYKADIGLLGEIRLPSANGPQYNDMYAMFKLSKIELFPNIDINGVGGGSSSYFNYFATDIDTKYILSNDLKFKDYKSYTAVNSTYGFTRTTAFFMGWDMQLNSSQENGGTGGTFNSCPNLKSIASRIILENDSTYSKFSSSIFNSSPHLDIDGKYSDVFIPAKRDIIEDPDWMPNIVELEKYDINDRYSSGITSTVNNRIVNVKNGKKIVSKWAQRHSVENEAHNSEDHTYASDNIWFSRNGKYAVQDGADVKIYGSDDILISTISGVEYNFASMNADGSRFLAIHGPSLDHNDSSGQTVSQSIKTYNTDDGSLIDTEYISTIENEELRGVYKYSDDGRMNVLITRYGDDLSGGLEMLSSKLFSKGDTIDYINLSTATDMISPSFAESAEFVCMSSVTGSALRMFSK